MSEEPTLVVTAPDWFTGARRNRYVAEELLKKAKSEIVILGYEVSDVNVIRILGERSAMGVAVQVFVDRSQASIHDLYRHWPPNAGEAVIWEGVELSKRGTLSSLHAKALLVDQVIALVGSANLTRSGLDNNIEVGLIVTGQVVRELRQFIERLIERGLVKERERLTGSRNR